MGLKLFGTVIHRRSTSKLDKPCEVLLCMLLEIQMVDVIRHRHCMGKWAGRYIVTTAALGEFMPRFVAGALRKTLGW